MNGETVELLEGMVEAEGLKFANVRRASHDAAVFFEWMSRLIKFCRLRDEVSKLEPLLASYVCLHGIDPLFETVIP